MEPTGDLWAKVDTAYDPDVYTQYWKLLSEIALALVTRLVQCR